MDSRWIGPLPRLRIYTTPAQYIDVFRRVITGRFTSGADVSLLEQAICDLQKARYAVAMPMARVGIYMAVKALIKPGQTVIMSPYTIADVVNMVVCAGGIPVFADIERETANIDPVEIERLIDENTGAVLVTHFYGLMCDVERIGAICANRGVPMIEDAAQAFGARLGSRAAGTFGAAGIYSFGLYKNINSFFGGMVVGNEAWLHDRIANEMAALPFQPLGGYFKKVLAGALTDALTLPAVFRMLTFWLFRFAFLHDVDSINRRLKVDTDPQMVKVIPASYLCQMTPLQAHLILRQLPRLERETQARIAASRRYYAGLRDIDELILPPMRTDGSHMYWYYPIQYRERHKLVGFAMKHGRDISESYHRNCADLACFAAFHRDCPNARATADQLIYLPTYPRYTESEIDQTISVVRRFFGRS
jgi:perosamine synthetase